MENTRTLAFQVPEDLFQKIKDYLQRNNMTQKEFVIGLIENEIERDLAQRAVISEAPTDSEELKEQDNDAISNDFDGEDEDLDDEPDELEDQGMSMVM